MNVNLTCRDYDSETASRRLTSDFLSILNATTTITLADIVKTEAQSMTIMTTQGLLAVAGERIEAVVEGRAAGLEVGRGGKRSTLAPPLRLRRSSR